MHFVPHVSGFIFNFYVFFLSPYSAFHYYKLQFIAVMSHTWWFFFSSDTIINTQGSFLKKNEKKVTESSQQCAAKLMKFGLICADYSGVSNSVEGI